MTSAIEALKEKIQDEDIVTVIGFSGSGKSTAVRNVALRLSRELKYQILAVHSPKDLMTYYIKGKRQLFVFDDVCGKYSLDLQKLMEWKDLSMDIRLLFGDGLLKCLFTCRPHIFNDSQFKGVDILSSIEHDILSPQYNLSNNERILIAKSHLFIDEVETIKRMSVFNKYDCLPLLCQFYSTNRNSNIVSFFNNPTQAIEDDLISFKHAPDQTTFSVLSLFVIYNNKIDRNDIKNRRFKKILSEISDNVRTSSALSRKVVTDNLTKLSNTYVRMIKDSYSIIHDKWFDTVVSFYGKHMFDMILRLCHPDIIRDRYQFEINQRYQSKESLVIYVPMEKEKDYMIRLCKDINDGYVQKVFTNKQLQYLTFRLKFIEQLRLKSNLKRNIRVFQDISPLLVVSQQNYLDIMEALLEIKVDVNVMNKFGTTPLFIASENDQVGMVKLLLTYKCDPNQRRELKNGETPLHVASGLGHKQVVRLLIRHNAITNICTTNQETPLYFASSKGFIDIVEILLENGSDPNICGKRNSPIFIASRLGHTEVVRLLLERNSDPNLLSEDIMHDGQSPLCIASKYGHTEIVQLLLEHRADSNLRANNGLFPLYIASRDGFTNIVKLLLDFKANQDMVVHFKTNKRQAMHFSNLRSKIDSPLCVATEKGFADIVMLLLQNKCDPNLCRNDLMDIHLSPLCISATYELTIIMKLLLKYGADPNFRIQGQDYELPLFIASANGNVQLVTLLLANSANPNICSNSLGSQGLSPLYVACEKGHVDIVQDLLKHKAAQNIYTKERKSPLQIAKLKGHKHIVCLLQQSNNERH